MILTFLVSTGLIALVYHWWTSTNSRDKASVLKSLCLGVSFSAIAAAILFIIVALF